LSLATPFNILGEPLIELPLVESTNIYAMEQIKAGLAKSGSVYFADFQSKGKGQMGKFWESEAGKNALISYTLEWQNPCFTNPFGISVAVSLAVYDFFSSYAGDETSIKWPNDVYWRDRKAVGILIENLYRGSQMTWSIIGTGINVNQTQFSAEVPNPVSLKQITGKTFDRKELIADLSAKIKMQINLWLEGQMEQQLYRYNELLYRKNQIQKFKSGNRIFEAVIKEVNEQGQLILVGGIQEAFNFGTIQWIK
jgi:BirA family biotin operon repressor/biotin-[acetyl-CoA-carboxylase] ligase